MLQAGRDQCGHPLLHIGCDGFCIRAVTHFEATTQAHMRVAVTPVQGWSNRNIKRVHGEIDCWWCGEGVRLLTFTPLQFSQSTLTGLQTIFDFIRSGFEIAS